MKPILISATFVATAAFSATGCTLALGDLDECDADADCESFGPGAVCEDGLCGTSASYVDPCEQVIGAGAGRVVNLGAVLPMTTDGRTADPRGASRRDAMELAIEEINARQGVAARWFRLRVCDSAGDRERVRAHARRLFDGGAVAILTAGADDTLAAFGEAKERGGLVMSVSATSPELTDLTDDGLVWRTAPSDAIQAKVLAELVAARSADPEASRVAVLEVDTVYGNGLRKVFKDNHVGEDEVFLFEAGGAGLDDRLGEANVYDPNAWVVIAGPVDAAAALNSLTQRVQLAEARVLLTDSSKNETFLSALDPGARALLQTTHDVHGTSVPTHIGTAPAVGQGEVFGTFSSRYQQSYGADPASLSFVAHSYDAVYSVALAVAWAVGRAPDDEPTGRTVAEGLAHLSDEGAAATAVEAANFSALQAALSAGEAVNLDGASGALDFDSATGDVTGLVEVWRITSDGFATVEIRTP